MGSLSPILPQNLGTRALSSSMMTFQTDSSQVLEKDTLDCKLAKIISKRFTSRGWTNDL